MRQKAEAIKKKIKNYKKKFDQFRLDMSMLFIFLVLFTYFAAGQFIDSIKSLKRLEDD